MNEFVKKVESDKDELLEKFIKNSLTGVIVHDVETLSNKVKMLTRDAYFQFFSKEIEKLIYEICSEIEEFDGVKVFSPGFIEEVKGETVNQFHMLFTKNPKIVARFRNDDGFIDDIVDKESAFGGICFTMCDFYDGDDNPYELSYDDWDKILDKQFKGQRFKWKVIYLCQSRERIDILKEKYRDRIFWIISGAWNQRDDKSLIAKRSDFKKFIEDIFKS